MKRILIVKVTSMGDVIHTLPAVATLKHNFPSSAISWVIRPRWTDLLRENPYIDELIPFERTIGGMQSALRQLRGQKFDLVVDFTTYVFVPAYAIAASGLLPQVLAIPAGIVVVITGALYFADREMKTKDNYFRGFPAVWNVAAFYLYVLEPPEWVAAAAIAILAGLSFAPVKFLHPLRVQRWRTINIGLLAVWAVLAFVAVVQDLSPGIYVTVPLSLIAVYFFAVGLLRMPA